MNLQEHIRRVLKEETEKFDKVKRFMKRANLVFSKLKFEAVKHVGFEYDERIEGFNVNITFDKQFAIDNPKIFNEVKKNAIIQIGSTVKSNFPFKFYFYIHYE
jgi:hypothetical protein